MSLTIAAPGKPYYAIRFEDVPAEFILGGSCGLCRHIGPVDRFRIERRWGGMGWLRHVQHRLRCLDCGNRHENRFTVVGRYMADQTTSTAFTG